MWRQATSFIDLGWEMLCVPILHVQIMISINLTRRMRSRVLRAILSACSQASVKVLTILSLKVYEWLSSVL